MASTSVNVDHLLLILLIAILLFILHALNPLPRHQLLLKPMALSTTALQKRLTPTLRASLALFCKAHAIHRSNQQLMMKQSAQGEGDGDIARRMRSMCHGLARTNHALYV